MYNFSVSWSVYMHRFFFERDFPTKIQSWLQIPNGIGCVSGLIQLILYALYFKCVVSIECNEQNKMQGKKGNLQIVTMSNGPISLEK